jgi:hypothetical protein
MNGVRRDLVTRLAYQIPSLLDVPMERKKGKLPLRRKALLVKRISSK